MRYILDTFAKGVIFTFVVVFMSIWFISIFLGVIFIGIKFGIVAAVIVMILMGGLTSVGFNVYLDWGTGK